MQHRAWGGAKHAEGAGKRRRSSGSGPRGDAGEAVPESTPPGCRRPAGRSRGEDGAAAVEFSLVLTLIVLLVFGIVQFGTALNKYQGMQASAREGARFGARSQATIGGIQQRVKESLQVVATGAAQYVDPCPSDPKTLDVEKVCVNVSLRNSSGAAPTLLTVTGYKPATQPCNLGAGKTVIVSVYHTIPIRIPVWPSTNITAGSTGEFRCET